MVHDDDDDDLDPEPPEGDLSIAVSELDEPDLPDDEDIDVGEPAEVTTHGNLKDDDDG